MLTNTIISKIIKNNTIKTFKLLLAIIIITSSFFSCSDDNDDVIMDENPLAEFTMLTTLTANSHAIEIYAEQDQFTVGYNELSLRIKDNDTNSYISGAEVSWMPLMHRMIRFIPVLLYSKWQGTKRSIGR